MDIRSAMQGEISRRKHAIHNSITKSLIDDEISGEKKSVEQTTMTSTPAKKVVKEKKIEKSLEEQYHDKLEKGEISDKLAYGYGSGSEALKFTKTGSEIKVILPPTILKLQESKVEIEVKMKALVVICGVDPTEPWNCSGICKQELFRYPYSVSERVYDSVSNKYADPTDIQTAASQYNELCYAYRNVLEDIASCQVILENLDDKKKYDLSVSQLVALSFGDTLSKGNEDELNKETEIKKEGKKIEKSVSTASDVLFADKKMRSAKIGNCIIADSQFDDNVAKSINTEIYSKNYTENFDEIIKSIQTRNVLSIAEVKMLAKNKIAVFSSDAVNKFVEDINKAVTGNEITVEEGRKQKVLIANLEQKKVQLEKGFGTIFISKTDLEKAIK